MHIKSMKNLLIRQNHEPRYGSTSIRNNKNQLKIINFNNVRDKMNFQQIVLKELIHSNYETIKTETPIFEKELFQKFHGINLKLQKNRGWNFSESLSDFLLHPSEVHFKIWHQHNEKEMKRRKEENLRIIGSKIRINELGILNIQHDQVRFERNSNSACKSHQSQRQLNIGKYLIRKKINEYSPKINYYKLSKEANYRPKKKLNITLPKAVLSFNIPKHNNLRTQSSFFKKKSNQI